MGVNFYRSPYVRGYIKDNLTGTTKILNGVPMQAVLASQMEEAKGVARGLYAAITKHEDTPPIEYPEHFGFRRIRRDLIRGVQFYNDDPTAEWVEFGAHAGGKTPVLKYRIIGRTFDTFEIL